MLPRLEKRSDPSRLMLFVTPVVALICTIVFGAAIFSLIGYDGPGAVWQIFARPVLESYRWQDLAVKASPLIIIGVGLSVAYRANVWNIGAEGQYVMGGLAATWVALATHGAGGWWTLPAMGLAGAAGGMAYAAIPAFLKTRFNVNEILTSLMLTYASVQLVYYLVRKPWKDPMGMGFPQTRIFAPEAVLPTLIPQTVTHWGIPVAALVALIAWGVMARTVFGYRIRAVGSAPRAARYGGFSARGTIWLALMVSGGLAGLAGMLEVAGPYQRMVPSFPTGYGFTAIIVAFLARLHPLGVIFAAFVLAVTFVGGELAQTSIGLPNAASGIFQAMMLFFLLAGDILVRYRLRFTSREVRP